MDMPLGKSREADRPGVDGGKRRIGWGTWIRTKDARVRAGSFTAKLSPKGARAGAITRPPAARNGFRENYPMPFSSRRSGAARGLFSGPNNTPWDVTGRP
jgi:hypothetical protein